MKQIAIIGAGVGGMAAAYDFSKAGDKVVIFEASNAPGGLASGFRKPGWKWSVEKFYHHWFTSDKYMFGLLRDLGLDSKIVIRRPVTVMYSKGRFYPFRLDPGCPALPRIGLGDQQDPLRVGWAVPAADHQLEADGKDDGGSLDAQVGGR